jgi:hypothetical protein
MRVLKTCFHCANLTHSRSGYSQVKHSKLVSQRLDCSHSNFEGSILRDLPRVIYRSRFAYFVLQPPHRSTGCYSLRRTWRRGSFCLQHLQSTCYLQVSAFCSVLSFQIGISLGLPLVICKHVGINWRHLRFLWISQRWYDRRDNWTCITQVKHYLEWYYQSHSNLNR